MENSNPSRTDICSLIHMLYMSSSRNAYPKVTALEVTTSRGLCWLKGRVLLLLQTFNLSKAFPQLNCLAGGKTTAACSTQSSCAFSIIVWCSSNSVPCLEEEFSNISVKFFTKIKVNKNPCFYRHFYQGCGGNICCRDTGALSASGRNVQMAVHMGTSLQQAQGACRCEIEEWLLVQLATDWAAHTCTFAGIRENHLSFLFIYKNKEDCMWFLTLYQIQLQAAFLRELLDPLYARRAGDTHLITSLQSENNPIWAPKAVTEEINGPRSASKYDVNGTTSFYHGKPRAGR